MARRKIPLPKPIDVIGDEWARTWGEAVNRNTAAKMLGVSRYTIYAWIDKGYLQITPNGHVIVRSAAEYAHSNPRPQQTFHIMA